MAGGRCPRSGHQYRPDVVGREGIAEFQGFPSGMSSVRLLMSAVWASGRSRDRVRGPGGGSKHPGPGCPLLVPVQGPAGAVVQRRLRHEFSSGLAGGAGIAVRTYFCLQDCVVSQTTTGRTQYSAGKRSPRTESTSWTRTAVTNASAQRPELLSPHRTLSTPSVARAPQKP